MTTLPFFTLDVFTRTPFEGNPLAVVLDADGLSTAQMQRMAAEFNLSETVFVLKPVQGGAAKLRIFTPGIEMPFAGHPTVGTAVLLAELRLVKGEQIVLEENVGPVPVRLVQREGEATYAELTTARGPEVRAPDWDVQQLPAVLGLPAEAITRVQMASCGANINLVWLTQPEHLAAIEFNPQAGKTLLASSWAHGFYPIARGYEGEWRVRFLAPDLGVGEDPATGGAAVALAGALALADERPDCTQAVPIVQGVEMGRPSQLYANYVRAGGAVQAVRVGGHAVRVSEGRIRVA